VSFFASNTDDTEECINFWKTGGYSAVKVTREIVYAIKYNIVYFSS